MGASKLFGAQVMMVQERKGAPPLRVHSSHKPANAIGPLLPSEIAKGCLSDLRHSKKLDAGTMQRRCAFNAPRNIGLLASPSSRALKVENLPISFAQDGTSPQRISSRW